MMGLLALFQNEDLNPIWQSRESTSGFGTPFSHKANTSDFVHTPAPMLTSPQQPVLVAQIPGTADAGGVNAPKGRVADEFAMSVHPHRAGLPRVHLVWLRLVDVGDGVAKKS
jgi:hypothetical protein